MSRVLLPSLRELESKEMNGLWALPAFFMAVSVYRTATYYNRDTVETLDMLFPLIFLLLAVISFTMYGLILRMLASATKNARAEAQAKLKELELTSEIDSLERMNRLKTDLMSTISHEARTPLAVLASYAGIVSMELSQKGVSEQTAADLDKIVSEAKRVADLIDNMKRLL